jgi:hypothetical protein
MRQKSESVLCYYWLDEPTLKIVATFREKYKSLSGVLDGHPEILALAHRDLRKVSQGGRQGRKGVFTSENILRTLVVMQAEGLSLRDAVVRVADSPFLCDFVRLGPRPMMDFTFVDKCFHAIAPETWQQINDVLARQAAADGIIDPSAVRTDTTVVEANIHYQMSCDFSAILSPAMLREFSVPELEGYMGVNEYSVYHWDGPDAVKHLDALLELPALKAIQWTPGAGQPRTSSPRWLPHLKRIQAAGKCLILPCAEPDEVEALLAKLSSRGLFISTYAATEDEARALLRRVAEWTCD